jgi:hypothetical protein
MTGHSRYTVKKSQVGMRQTPMLTTVAQNQTTWEKEFSDPHVVWFAPLLSTSEFREAFFTVYINVVYIAYHAHLCSRTGRLVEM